MSRNINSAFVLLPLALAVALLVAHCGAVSTTNAATMVGTTNATLNGQTTLTYGWFVYGMNSGKLYLTSPNCTPAAGAIAYVVEDYPLFGGTGYYYKACDEDGCDVEASFIIPAPTPLPDMGLGRPMTNMTQSKFSTKFILSNVMTPIGWVLPQTPPGTAIAMISGLFMFAILGGMWYRSKGVTTPALVGMILLALILPSTQGPILGMSQEFVAFGQCILYIVIAGIVFTIFKK